MTRRLLIMAAICSMLALLAGCDSEQRRLDEEVRRLCAEDGGVKVYETVKLTPELLDRYGRIRTPSIERAKKSDEYYYVQERVYLKGSEVSEDYEARMWRTVHKIIRRSDGRVLGESIDYVRRGGGILSPPFHPSSFSCSDISKSPAIETSIFVKENDK